MPSEEAVTEAAAGTLKNMPADFRTSITNASGKGAYPISSYTYLLIHKTQPNPEKGPKLVKFLRWAMNQGQTMTSSLHYAPLPKSLIKKVEVSIASIVEKKVN